MAQKIRMNTDKLLRDCGELEAALQELKRCLQGMKADVDRLNAVWEGPSHESFLADYNRDYQEMEALNKGLEQYFLALRQAQKDYVSCEEQVAGLVQGI